MFKDYLTKSERQYHYRIKTLVDMDDTVMSRIERGLIKYLPISVSQPKKTMFQARPMDFPGIVNAEVFFIDVVLGLPVSFYVLQQELAQMIGLPDKFVAVIGENNPFESEMETIEDLHDINASAEKDGLQKAALLDMPDYDEAVEVNVDEIAGQNYNSKLLSYLKKMEKEREDATPNRKNPLFAFARDKVDSTNFNDHIKDAPKTDVSAAKPKEDNESFHGNLFTTGGVTKRVFKDADGNKVVMTRKANSVKNERK